MLSFWISLPALLGIYFGFASTLGSLIYRLRAAPAVVFTGAVIFFGGLVYLPASLALPFPLWFKGAAWLFGCALVLLFALRPSYAPHWLWSPNFHLRYASGVMALILLWSLANGLYPPNTLLGVMASWAGGLALIRSRNFAC